MVRSPNNSYFLIAFLLVFILSGCALQRNDNNTADAEPLGNGVPPTLAPLGADSSELAGVVSANPTVVTVNSTATTSAFAAGTATDNAAPTNQPAVELSGSAAASDGVEEAAVEPETFTPPAEQASSTQPVIVDATSEELPTGGPIAVNPPASGTTENYDATLAAAPTPGDGTGVEYVVQPGDTLFGLALAYGTSVQAITQANSLSSEMIYNGQSLIIPGYDGSYTVPVYTTDYPSDDGEHIVSAGETLFGIAASYGTSVEALAIVNGLSQPYMIYAGQALTIATLPAGDGYAPGLYDNQAVPGGYDSYDNPVVPGGYGSHTIVPGETLYFIAQRYGVTTQSLAAANGIYNANQIQAGQVLTIPAPY